MSVSRVYSTRRVSIVTSLVNLFKTIDGSGAFTSNISQQIFGKLRFFSEVTEFPAVCVVASNESRIYQTGGYRDRYLDVKVIIFVNEENALDKCEAILEDIETVIEDNGRLPYIDRDGNTQYTHDITILSLSTDEGTLEPISLGEIALRVHY